MLHAPAKIAKDTENYIAKSLPRLKLLIKVKMKKEGIKAW